MNIVPDSWLSEQFGRSVYALHQLRVGDLDHMALKDGFYYAKVPASDVDIVHYLTRRGMHVIDVALSFERMPGLISTPVPDVVVRSRERKDEKALLRIAASAFEYSRFHLDPLIPLTVANRVKRAWIGSYLNGMRGQRVLVAERDGVVAGFLAEMRDAEGEREIVTIDLIAVSMETRKVGVGRGLVSQLLIDSAAHADVVRVGTQASNIPSVRLYEGLGFRLASSQFILHGHFTNSDRDA